jgi:hypothetical protein
MMYRATWDELLGARFVRRGRLTVQALKTKLGVHSRRYIGGAVGSFVS